MRALRLVWLSLPLALAAGCLLPSFETIESTGSGGSGGAGGASGSGGKGGSGPGAGGQMDTGGEGGGGTNVPIVVTADEYVVRQGEELTRIATQGFLANDDGDGLRVTGVTKTNDDLPTAYDGTLEVEPDGSFSFTPAAEFFGAFRATYEVSDSGGNTATAQVTIFVQPVAADVAVLAEGVGGFCVDADSSEEIGRAVAGVGDTDGDGLADFAVGAPGSNGGAGRLYVVRGAERGEAITLGDPSSNEDRYFALDGTTGSRLGAAVAWAGDIDGDGLDDFVIGAPGQTNQRGAVHVIASVSNPPPQEDVTDAQEFSVTGANADNTGRIVAGGHDFTGDGLPDPIAVGSNPPDYFGCYYVFDAANPPAGSLASLCPDDIAGADDNDFESQAAASVGDVDGDGENDLLLAGASVIALVRGPESNFPANLGSSFAQNTHGWTMDRTASGASSVSVAGGTDVDGDGEPDIVYCDGEDVCQVVFGPIDNLLDGLSIDFSGTIALVAISDLDGDGIAELAFTDGFDVFVVYGGSMAKSGSAQIDDLSDEAGFVLSDGGSIASVATVGDVNGDGYGDLAFGIPLTTSGDGRVCVLYGTPKAD